MSTDLLHTLFTVGGVAAFVVVKDWLVDRIGHRHDERAPAQPSA